MFDDEDQFITVRVNGGKIKSSDELSIEFNENLTLKFLIKQACKKFANMNPNPGVAKIYNRNGVHLLENDIELIAANDILYIALKGEDFNYCAILDDYELGKTLGVGGFGKVVLGRHKENKTEVAIKFTDVGEQLSSANLIQAIYKEAESLKALQQKHIIKLYHAFIDNKQFVMVMEAAMGGELYHYLKKHERMEETIAREILLQIVGAMLYCHSRGVVHRDLKLENVLFKSEDEGDFLVKVVDFGIAGVAQEKVDAGTLSYMAPECLERVAADTTPAIDVWAIGVMLYAMIYGQLPFQGIIKGEFNEKELIRQIKNEPVRFPRSVPVTDETKEIIKSMLQKEPSKRIELIDFVQLPYNIMEEEEFAEKVQKNKQEWEINKKQHEEQEEQKMQEKFMAQLELSRPEDNKHVKEKSHHSRATSQGKKVKKKSAK